MIKFADMLYSGMFMVNNKGWHLFCPFDHIENKFGLRGEMYIVKYKVK